MPKGKGRPFNRGVKAFSKSIKGGIFTKGHPFKAIREGSVEVGITGLRRSGGKTLTTTNTGFSSGSDLQRAMMRNSRQDARRPQAKRKK